MGPQQAGFGGQGVGLRSCLAVSALLKLGLGSTCAMHSNMLDVCSTTALYLALSKPYTLNPRLHRRKCHAQLQCSGTSPQAHPQQVPTELS